MKNKTLYMAYGSNLNLGQMAHRCPTAKPIGTAMLKDWQLTFRRVATIEPQQGAETPVGIWEIGERDERALDIYEGYPHLYRKEYLPVEVNGKTEKVMVYIMNKGVPDMPTEHYYNTIKVGYYDVGLDPIHLENAIKDTMGRMEKRN